MFITSKFLNANKCLKLKSFSLKFFIRHIVLLYCTILLKNKNSFSGSFEVEVNETLIYSKLKTMALPDYNEVATVIHDVAQGSEIREIKKEQPINCVIS